MHTTQKPSDIPAAYRGMLLGLMAVVVIIFTIVKLTNAKYAGREASAPAAAQH